MKTKPVSSTSRQRNLACLAGASAVCLATLSLASARTLEPRPQQATLASPAPETLEVDASLFTTQNFDWFDDQRQRQVPAKLYLPSAPAVAGSVPLDLRYALDQILATHEGALFDTRRIVAAGHSYGANTTMLMAGAKIERQGKTVSLRDPRISAAIIISAPPFYGLGDPGKILSGIDVPTLHITATEDIIQIPGYVSDLQDRMGTGGLNLNPKVKIATRQLALAFLDGIPASDFRALDAWPLSNAELVAQFQKLTP